MVFQISTRHITLSGWSGIGGGTLALPAGARGVAVIFFASMFLNSLTGVPETQALEVTPLYKRHRTWWDEGLASLESRRQS